MKAYDDSMYFDPEAATRLTPDVSTLRVLVVDPDLDAATVTAELLVASAHQYLQAGFDRVLDAPVEPLALEAVLGSVRQHLGCGFP